MPAYQLSITIQFDVDDPDRLRHDVFEAAREFESSIEDRTGEFDFAATDSAVTSPIEAVALSAAFDAIQAIPGLVNAVPVAGDARTL